jgi:hypothetical protein
MIGDIWQKVNLPAENLDIFTLLFGIAIITCHPLVLCHPRFFVILGLDPRDQGWLGDSVPSPFGNRETLAGAK